MASLLITPLFPAGLVPLEDAQTHPALPGTRSLAILPSRCVCAMASRWAGHKHTKPPGVCGGTHGHTPALAAHTLEQFQQRILPEEKYQHPRAAS